MKRLTKRGTRKNGYVSAIGSGLGCWEQIIDRLAAYEDTGLMPEEIKGALFGGEHNVLGAFNPPNAPMTLEELREMDGEPVWVCNWDGSGGTWALVDAEHEVCRRAKGGLAIFYAYNKTWLAYRRKPEGGAT